jgi:hypothetical protein
VGRDSVDRPMILFAPDETTRAFVDLYAGTAVDLIPGPITPLSAGRLRAELAAAPRSVVLTQLPGRSQSRTVRGIKDWLGLNPRTTTLRPDPDPDPTPDWALDARLRIAHLYALPNGRRYALLESVGAAASR